MLNLYRPFCAVVAGVLLSFSAQAQSSPRQFLAGHVPPEVLKLAPLGQLAPSDRLHLAIGLPVRNPEAMAQLLAEVSDPASPNYRHYLSPQQFTDAFGPSEQDYETVASFFTKNGFAISKRHSNRVVLDVQGSVADIERVFHLTLRTYRHPTEPRDFYAPDAEPSLDLPVKILHVSGLNNLHLPHPNFRPSLETPKGTVGTGINGSYRGNDFRAAYLPGIPTNVLSGKGQAVALLEFDGYYANDIVTYANLCGLPNVPLVNVPVDGGVRTISSGGSEEVSLDIEMVMCMAPGVSQILVYEAPNPTPFADILNQIANDNAAPAISCSWGGSNPDPVSEQIFQQMALQGQTFLNASGDNDAFVGRVPFPSDSANITQVGGTKLWTSAPGGVWTNETVWNSGSGIGSAGGVSTTYTIPTWQQGINMKTNKGSATMRNVPDVAMVAQHIEVRYGNGKSGTIVGTSAAAPLWAGFIALANEYASGNGQPPVGFINPAIYAIGKSTNYNACFHDIIKGNNTWTKSLYKYYAKPGYDLCTGWGSPKAGLFNALLISDDLMVFPGYGFVANGVPGGPFDTTSRTFAVTNNGGSSIDWVLLNVPAWLDANDSAGTLSPGTAIYVTLDLNSTASNLVAGVYSAGVIFSNATTGMTQTRQFILNVGQNIVANGGFESGDFGLWTFTGSRLQNGVVKSFAHSGKYGAEFGQVNSLASISQTLPTYAGQGYLLSFWVKNPAGGSSSNPEKFIVKWDGNILLSLTNPRAFGWTNYQYTVTASTDGTVFQIQAQNNPSFFGVDDISVTPIAAPAIAAMVQSASTTTLTWNSTAGVKYQVQTSTDLVHWQDIGAPVTAEDKTATITIDVGSEQQRFYRVHWLP